MKLGTIEGFEHENFSKEMIKEAYKTTYSELDSQQSKRDTLFGIFISLITFSIPLTLGANAGWLVSSILFMAVGLIGILFSFIIIRYREYKESYWLACRTLSILETSKHSLSSDEEIKKIYFYCMKKNGCKLFKEKDGKKRVNWAVATKKTLHSAETIYYLIVAGISSTLIGIASGFLFNLLFNLSIALSISLGALIGVFLFLLMLIIFIRKITLLYEALITEEDDKKFNRLFSKAWTLHLYVDEKKQK